MPWQRYIPKGQDKEKPRSPFIDHTPKNIAVKVTGGANGECSNVPVKVIGLTKGAIAKIPVILAQLTLQLNMNAMIELPESALDIKSEKNTIEVKQCVLLQDTHMLFIKGYVCKQISYIAGSYYSYGETRHCTVKIPFECNTEVIFNGIEPIYLFSNQLEACGNDRSKDICIPNYIQKDNPFNEKVIQKSQKSIEYFNEMPYCELVSSNVIEINEYMDLSRFHLYKKEKTFKSIEEKMVVYLTLRILQNRPVNIPSMDITISNEDLKNID
ncbi:CsxC family protein [Inediibacterium massiliense]|uniref:CsxC family protein n=1 Tax=Inediibacterium massiliense TaxID=1658111 RepID=UPI0006B6521C|nr:hypothetical protein [Inediibacterium massiliense]